MQNRSMQQEHRRPLPLVTLEDVTLRLGKRFILNGTSWEIFRDQNWAVLGPNGSGKSSLVGAIAGEVPVANGRIVYHFENSRQRAIGYVSFGLHQRTIQREEQRDEAREFSGNMDSFETVRQTLADRPEGAYVDSQATLQVIERLEIGNLMDRSIRHLSTGEIRKVLIAKAMLKSPRLLILDEPFDGLDREANRLLKKYITGLAGGDTNLILVTHRTDEITPNITHILCLKEGGIFLSGEKEQVLADGRLRCLYLNNNCVPGNGSAVRAPEAGPVPPVIIEMRNASVSYGGIEVFKNIDWIMKKGENWALIGPNGAGKSSFLRLITGDNLQAYANEIYVFGHRRGTGESVWEIKKRIGIVSSEFQVRYRKRISAYDVVLSGFYDSIGLYSQATARQHEEAGEWMERIGIMHLGNRRFDLLSDGEKRLVLLARAMVKTPALLILDEPVQGLDPYNRSVMLDIIDRIGREYPTHLLYVTHQPDDVVPSITHVLKFERGTQGKAAVVSRETGRDAVTR